MAMAISPFCPSDYDRMVREQQHYHEMQHQQERLLHELARHSSLSNSALLNHQATAAVAQQPNPNERLLVLLTEE